VPEWAKLRRGEPVSLDRALGCFDLFIPESGYGDLDDVSAILVVFYCSPVSDCDFQRYEARLLGFLIASSQII
jgi:hypothetical protein